MISSCNKNTASNTHNTHGFQAFTVVGLRPSFFWDMALHSWVFLSLDIWPLKMRPSCCLKTSGTDHPVTQHHTHEEWRSHMELVFI